MGTPVVGQSQLTMDFESSKNHKLKLSVRTRYKKSKQAFFLGV